MKKGQVSAFRNMDYTLLTEARKDVDSIPGLCNLFRLLAIETWKSIEFAYERKDRAPYETTITQNLLFAIQSLADQNPDLPNLKGFQPKKS